MAPTLKNRGGGQGRVRRNVGGVMMRCYVHDNSPVARRCQVRAMVIPTDEYDAVYAACDDGNHKFDPPPVGRKIPPGSPTPLPPREG